MPALTAEQVGHALQEEMQVWQGHQSDALRNVSFPGIEEEDELKGFAWFNFGVNATQSLYPGSTAASIARAAKSVASKWWVGQAKSAFNAVRDTIIESHNNRLRRSFTEIRDSFERHIDRVERSFRTSEIGSSIIRSVMDHWSGRDFVDGNEAIVECRVLIKAAQLVENESAVIRRRTQAGFGGLCRKIKNIYLGMQEGPGQNRMYEVMSDRMSIDSFGRQHRDTRRVRTETRERWILAHAWQMRVEHFDRDWYEDGPDVTTVTRINRAQNPLRLADTFRARSIDLASAERRMDEYR